MNILLKIHFGLKEWERERERERERENRQRDREINRRER